MLKKLIIMSSNEATHSSHHCSVLFITHTHASYIDTMNYDQLKYFFNLYDLLSWYGLTQKIQYAKTKSDVIAKADGTFVPRERRKRHEEKGKAFGLSLPLVDVFFLFS